MEVLIAAAVGLFTGAALCCFVMYMALKKRIAGTLRVDRSEPDEAPYLFLEVEHNGMEKIHKKKMVIFKVDLSSYLPR